MKIFVSLSFSTENHRENERSAVIFTVNEMSYHCLDCARRRFERCHLLRRHLGIKLRHPEIRGEDPEISPTLQRGDDERPLDAPHRKLERHGHRRLFAHESIAMRSLQRICRSRVIAV